MTAAPFKIINNGAATLGAGATAWADLNVVGFSTLTVVFRIGNATTPATAAGDCNAGIGYYEDDGVTMVPPLGAAYMLPDTTVRAATLTGSYSYSVLRYNVASLSKVRVQLTNNNVAALQGATAVVYLG